MRTPVGSIIAKIVVTAMFLVALLPGSHASAAQPGETTYVDDEHGVSISWTNQWTVGLPSVEAPVLNLERDSSVIVLISIMDSQEASPEEAVWFLYTEEDEIIDDRSTEDPPHLTLALHDSGLTYSIEAYSLNNGETTALVAVGTVPVLQESAIDIVQQDIKINGFPVMTGQPLGEAVDLTGDATPDLTGDATPETNTRSSRVTRGTTETPEATAEATAESGRSSRVSRDTTETPEATEEPTTEITRTSRTGSGDPVTPEETEVPTVEPTAEATEAPTEEVVESENPGTYTGSVWGYTITWDTEKWEQKSTFDFPSHDGVRLDGESSTLFVTGSSDYGADPVGCLIGEDEYFQSTEGVSTSDWEVATDANGDPLWYESDELAWGVFNYTFHSSSGIDVEFVDYISCETIPGEDAVLIVQMTSFPDEYNTNLEALLDILDTLEFQP